MPWREDPEAPEARLEVSSCDEMYQNISVQRSGEDGDKEEITSGCDQMCEQGEKKRLDTGCMCDLTVSNV